MRVFSARVSHGAIVDDELEGLPDGARVTVLVDDDDDDELELSPAEEDALVASIQALDRGEGIPFEDVLREIDSIEVPEKK